MFEVNDLVIIKKEWRDPSSKDVLVWRVLSVNQDLKRCTIETSPKGLALPVVEVVTFEMIEKL